MSNDREIVTARIFEAPRQTVFQAWTDPNHLQVWWGPNGFTNTFHTFDFKVGGRWIFTMHGPEKGNYQNECTFLTITPPEFVAWSRQSKPLFRVEVSFNYISENETEVIFKQVFDTVEECDKLRKFVPEKNEENMDRLEVELKKMLETNI